MEDSFSEREAQSLYDSTRQQKFRAAICLLKAVAANPSAIVFVGVEHFEDVYTVVENDETSENAEQNKYYESKNFTLNSTEVTKSLIGFLELWIYKNFDSNVRFSFVSTNTYTKEKNTKSLQELGVNLPEKPILELLSQGDIDETLVKNVSKVLVSLLDENTRYKETIEKLSEDNWKEFLKQIDWFFGTDDNDSLKSEAIELVKNCSFFGSGMIGHEETILLHLLEKIEERVQKTNRNSRFLSNTELELLFIRLESTFGVQNSVDPAWTLWNNLNVEDKRTLREKIIAVCEDYPNAKSGNIQRRLALSIAEQEDYRNNRAFLSLKYRVYLKCSEYLANSILNGEIYDHNRIDQSLQELTDIGFETINDLSSDYDYPFSSKEIVGGVVYELFEKCFLAFDELENNG